jgi:Uri superfamily endonuclease
LRISADLKAQLPVLPGAYALIIDLGHGFRLPIRRLGVGRIGPGRLIYCGSARGPGGINARLTRHLRRDKKQHWHVDHLTARGRVTAAAAFLDGSECELVPRALALPGADVPVPGFGSSDCRACASHLIGVPGSTPLAVIFRALGAELTWRMDQ